MAKSANQKLKLLRLYEVLLRQSDEDHPISVPQLIQELARWDIKAERKSVYDDLDTLAELGVDIQSRKGRNAGWFIGEREFELAELKLLVDAVQSSRFITKRKSDSLIRKLEKLASTHQAHQLQRQVYVDRRVKAMNESIYYNVDLLHAAIAQHKVITFRYFDHNMAKERVFRREGGEYRVSPYGLIWNSENYYLVGQDEQLGQLRHYRVDKMAALELTEQGCVVPAQFNVADYAQKHFSMFSGSEVNMTLRFRSDMAGVVLDRFGQDVMLIPDGGEYFTVTLPLVMSPQFFGWLFGLGDGVCLVGPERAVQAYRAQLGAVNDLYQDK
ncbi:MAG: WYL domain-containing protein [Oscillospiraceae bacterium]|nr:WYL domain-containing protein [Oscillospiraceae bacterium]